MNQVHTNRRDFIKAAAASAVVTPYILTSSTAVAQDENSKLNVAAIGVGGRGTDIGMQASSLGNMVACADVHSGNANRFAEQVLKIRGRKCEVFEDYRRILDRDDVDAITCGTTDHWHTKIAIDAMQAGKDVYCEKPLTLTIGESQQIMRATEQTGRIFQVGTQQRSEFDKRFLKAVAIARSGRLGNGLQAISSVGRATAGGPFQTQPVPEELNFDFWLGQAPLVDFCPERIGWNFRWWLEYSGGQVTDWGVHHTDIALWALGGEETGVIEVKGEGDFPGSARGHQYCRIPQRPRQAATAVQRGGDFRLRSEVGQRKSDQPDQRQKRADHRRRARQDSCEPRRPDGKNRRADRRRQG